MESESRKQLKELERQQAQDRQYAGPAVTQHGYEVGGMTMTTQQHAAKAAEMESKMSAGEKADYWNRRHKLRTGSK